MDTTLTASQILPADGTAGTLVGRVWRPDLDGPSVVVVRKDGSVEDVTRAAPTVAGLMNEPDPVALLRGAAGERLGTVDEILANSAAAAAPGGQGRGGPWFLAPVDLQAVKAAG